MSVPPYLFDFDDVVRIVSDHPELAEINGERGVVVGKGEEGLPPGYAVWIYRLERVWDVEQEYLEATGETDPREPPTHAVRVAVDAEGRGTVVGVRALGDAPPHPGVRFPPPFLFAAGLFGGWALERRWPLPLVSPARTGMLEAIGVALVVLGLGLAFWGILTFRRARTAIIPNQPASHIVETGPYRFTRNPMYVGLTVAYLGGALVLNAAWPLALLPFVLAALVVLVIRREERYLTAAFGPDYDAYRRRVRRWL